MRLYGGHRIFGGRTHPGHHGRAQDKDLGRKSEFAKVDAPSNSRVCSIGGKVSDACSMIDDAHVTGRQPWGGNNTATDDRIANWETANTMTGVLREERSELEDLAPRALQVLRWRVLRPSALQSPPISVVGPQFGLEAKAAQASSVCRTASQSQPGGVRQKATCDPCCVMHMLLVVCVLVVCMLHA